MYQSTVSETIESIQYVCAAMRSVALYKFYNINAVISMLLLYTLDIVGIYSAAVQSYIHL